MGCVSATTITTTTKKRSNFMDNNSRTANLAREFFVLFLPKSRSPAKENDKTVMTQLESISPQTRKRRHAVKKAVVAKYTNKDASSPSENGTFLTSEKEKEKKRKNRSGHPSCNPIPNGE